MLKPNDIKRIGTIVSFSACMGLFGLWAVHAWNDARGPEIEFYGRVIDQDDNPVVGARVVMHRYVMRGTNEDPNPETTTDTDGRFTFTGARGTYLSVTAIDREGYIQPPINSVPREFQHPNREPIRFTPDAPVVFRLHKTTGKLEPLLRVDYYADIPADGTVYSIDFTKKEVIKGATDDADLQLSVTRGAVDVTQRSFTWVARIVANGGGIVQTGAEPDLDAIARTIPDDRFVAQAEWGFAADDKPWRDGIGQEMIFVRSRGGQHAAQLIINLWAYSIRDEHPARFRVEGIVNPAGTTIEPQSGQIYETYAEWADAHRQLQSPR
ncbi:MAG: hypothetical protein GC159_19665 [Phycisphaera sp.]|nr:hypothetical protein [Phycisphaera sp.]